MNPLKTILVCSLLGLGFLSSSASAASVRIERLPEAGVQPQVFVDRENRVHRLWLSGDPKAAEVLYQSKALTKTDWGKALQVNSIPGAAIAVGTVRGARLSVGDDGTVHVLWNGSPRTKLDDKGNVPLLYSRLAPGMAAFEKERNLLGSSRGLDGGAALVTLPKGGVMALWHGAPRDGRSEADRRIYANASHDGGVSFDGEKALGVPAGVCGCCGLSASASAEGRLLVLYRQASELTHRGVNLLVADANGNQPSTQTLEDWSIASCPMSTSAVLPGKVRSRLAWETRGTISSVEVDAQGRPIGKAVTVSLGTTSKHPAMATNARGETLVAWTEGTGWQRGGQLAWIVLDSKGQPLGARAQQAGIPVWGHPAVFASSESEFVILY